MTIRTTARPSGSPAAIARIAAIASITFVLQGSGVAQAQTFKAWLPAANIGPVVNTDVLEGCPFITRGEHTLFLVSVRPEGFGGQDVYVSLRDSVLEPWGPPQNLGPKVNSAANDFCPTLSIDGHQLFFTSDRPGGFGKQDNYVARRTDIGDEFGWRRAVNLGPALNSAENDFAVTLFHQRRRTVLYFSSDRPGGTGAVDIYSSTTDGEGELEPAELVVELSTELIDERPNVSKDGLEIYIDSNRTGTMGSTDLWVAKRAGTNEPWSLPVNLGPNVNSESAEVRPSLSYDGRTLYFNSPRPGGYGGSDIYLSKRAKTSDATFCP